METAELIEALRRPGAYSHGVEEVGFRQTHISLLFFAGDRVYKLKKPVDLGFLDFTTLARRRRSCRAEVRLNRRLAPWVYRGVVPICRSPNGSLRVDGAGEIVEWAVEMVRLPEQRMLETLLERGEIDNQMLNDLADVLAGFHARADGGRRVRRFGAPEAVARNVLENFSQTRPFVDSGPESARGASAAASAKLHGFLEAAARTALEGRRELFERRVREGRIREGHGDLHAGNICFAPDGIAIYDCVEFARRFRCCDVACDLAFLAMDLDYRELPSFGDYLARRYAKVAGDGECPELMGFYKGYRAVVRAKVACLAAADPAASAADRAERLRGAARYFHLAASYELPPALVLLCGLPGTGKTWIARALSPSLRAMALTSDVRRKAEAGLPAATPAAEPYGSGLYSLESRQRTYRSMLAAALRFVEQGRSVVVDASFSREAFRRPFLEAAARSGHPLFVVHVTAPEGVVRARLASRTGAGGEPSDADLGVYREERKRFEPPSEVRPDHLVEIRSDASPPEAACARLLDGMIDALGVPR